MVSKNIKYCIALILVFVIVSFLFINPIEKKARSQYRSSQLTKIIAKSENGERIDYIDADGRITIAADLGYATIIVTKTEKESLEQYYDDKGEPISRYNGYYALLREYDDQGNNIRTSYLDLDGNPVMMANGYAIEEMEYNENRQSVSSRYYDTEGNPVLTPSYGHGRIKEYDENGRVCKMTYIDKSGLPVMTGQGYAIITRNYYEYEGPDKGRVESEFYYDETGNPVSLSLGQYGVHKEYNEDGRESVLVYLNANGEPIATNKGYTKIVRTYQPDNAIETEQYYDLEGKPFRLSEGQYGFIRENDKTIYLDANGNRQFNLKNLLYNQSWFVIAFAALGVLLSALVNRKWNVFLLILYLGVIVYFTLMYRETGEKTVNLDLFWSYKDFFSDSGARADIIKNIWLFIPLGAILYRLGHRKIILVVPFFISLAIELIQYFTGTGLCELDDVFSNGIGGCIGYAMGSGIQQVLPGMKNKLKDQWSR